jgi:signal transduction histidine kinase
MKKVEGIVRDISAEKRASARNRDLAGRLIASQEAERQRIARELHDDLSQKVALMSIDIDELGRVASERERSLRLRQLAERVAEIATDIHELSRDLHPSKLQTLGLVAAVQALCRDVAHQHHLRVDFDCEGLPTVVGPEVSLCLYRITQEALHNIVRHSGARQAMVRLERDGDELSLQVADQGIGFQPRNVEGAGLGLISIRERAAYLGGRLVIHAAPGSGTRIGVRVPLEPESRWLPRAQSA